MLYYPVLFILAFMYMLIGLEWVIHKYFFHGLGKNKKSYFAGHWHIHHQTLSGKMIIRMITYKEFPPHPSVKQELISLFILILLHTPVLFISPFFFGSLVYFSFRYFYIHRKVHTDVEWGKKYFPWHYDHHMGKNQDANWGVTHPLMGPYFRNAEKKFVSISLTVWFLRIKRPLWAQKDLTLL